MAEEVMMAGPRARDGAGTPRPVVLGLRANRGQFLLLVLINGFVGAMVGLERTVIPLIATRQFGIASASAALSFIVAFGVVKALTNVVAGSLSDRVGRKGVLVAGWLVGIPVPLLILWAPAWGWIILANALLGVNQALCWSMTVNMKIDLAGPARRGLALGINESAGYAAVGLATLAAGSLAAAYGLRQGPFTLGVAFPVLGLLLSALFVRETRGHVRLEARQAGDVGERPSLRRVFAWASWRDRGLLPLFFARAGLGIGAIALISAAYLLSWGVLQLGTGALSDRWGASRSSWGGWRCKGWRWRRSRSCAAKVRGWARPSCWDWARRWSTRRCWPQWAMWRTRRGGPRPWASTACGATWATPWARCSPALSPTSRASPPRS